MNCFWDEFFDSLAFERVVAAVEGHQLPQIDDKAETDAALNSIATQIESEE